MTLSRGLHAVTYLLLGAVRSNCTLLIALLYPPLFKGIMSDQQLYSDIYICLRNQITSSRRHI